MSSSAWSISAIASDGSGRDGAGAGINGSMFDPNASLNWAFGDQGLTSNAGASTGMAGDYGNTNGGGYNYGQPSYGSYSNGPTPSISAPTHHATTTSPPAPPQYNVAALQALLQSGDLSQSAYEALTGIAPPPSHTSNSTTNTNLYPSAPSSQPRWPPSTSSVPSSSNLPPHLAPPQPPQFGTQPQLPTSTSAHQSSLHPYQSQSTPYSLGTSAALYQTAPPFASSSSQPLPSPHHPPQHPHQQQQHGPYQGFSSNEVVNGNSIPSTAIQAQLDLLAQAKDIERQLTQLRGVMSNNQGMNGDQRLRLEREGESLKSRHTQLLSQHNTFLHQHGGQDHVRPQISAYIASKKVQQSQQPQHHPPQPSPSSSNFFPTPSTSSPPYPSPPSSTQLSFSIPPPSQNAPQPTYSSATRGPAPSPLPPSASLPPGLQASVLARQRAQSAAAASPPVRPPSTTKAKSTTGAGKKAATPPAPPLWRDEPLARKPPTIGNRPVAPIPKKYSKLPKENATTTLAKGVEGMPTLAELQNQLRPDQFYSSLLRVLEKRGMVLKEPYYVEGKRIPLYEFYQAVMVEGHGGEQVNADQDWAHIAKIIDCPTTPSFAQGLANVYRDALSVYEAVWAEALLRQRNRLATTRRIQLEGEDGSGSGSSRGSGGAPIRPISSLPTMLKFSEAPPSRALASDQSFLSTYATQSSRPPPEDVTPARQPFFDPLAQDPSPTMSGIPYASGKPAPGSVKRTASGTEKHAGDIRQLQAESEQFAAQMRSVTTSALPVDMSVFFNLTSHFDKETSDSGRFQEVDADEPAWKQRRTDSAGLGVSPMAQSPADSSHSGTSKSSGKSKSTGKNGVPHRRAGSNNPSEANFTAVPFTPGLTQLEDTNFSPFSSLAFDVTASNGSHNSSAQTHTANTSFFNDSNVLSTNELFQSIGLQASPAADTPELVGDGHQRLGSDGSPPSDDALDAANATSALFTGAADPSVFDPNSLYSIDLSWTTGAEESWQKYGFGSDLTSQWGI